jgi:hypothetical protein
MQMTNTKVHELVAQIEHICGNPRPDLYCALLTVTVNLLQVVEDDEQRKRTQEAYINALKFLCAVEEQFQPEDKSRSRDPVNQLTAEMMRHVFDHIGG